MHINKLLLLISLVTLVGCAHKQAKDDTASAPENTEVKAEKTEVEPGAMVGTPAKGSKFSKIKPGMTMKEVVAKIGKPDNQWERPTGKQAIPFYFGDDRWVIEATYKKEGKLTFNQGGDQTLTGIVVNKAEE